MSALTVAQQESIRELERDGMGPLDWTLDDDGFLSASPTQENLCLAWLISPGGIRTPKIDRARRIKRAAQRRIMESGSRGLAHAA